MYSETATACAELVRGRVQDNVALFLVADVVDGASRDLAVSLCDARLAVIRCVRRTSPQDHIALATMMTEGDFVWAGLVYGEREGSETVGLIETFHVGELDRLVSRLLELREVFGEPG